MNTYLALLPRSGPVPEIAILPFFIAWIWAVIDCFTAKSMKRTEKIAWIVALIFLNVFAAVAFWAVRFLAKRKRGFKSSVPQAS